MGRTGQIGKSQNPTEMPSASPEPRTGSWKKAEAAELNNFVQRRGNEPALEPLDIHIEDTSTFELRDFWQAPPLGDYWTEATMLRTVDWCAISGFEPWWNRLAKRREEIWLRGGMEEPAQAAYWLFNMIRSDYAMKLMPRVLDGCLRSISLTGANGRAPWITDPHGTESAGLHLAHASTIVFAHHRLNLGNPDAVLLPKALGAISKHQHESGGWPAFTGDSKTSIESTAMALHALALAQPAGWPRIAGMGRDWL